MRLRNVIYILTFCFLTGVIGGFLFRYFSSKEVLANSETIEALELILIDEMGRNAGRWVSAEPAGIYLYDTVGRHRLDLGLFPDGRPVIAWNDEKGLCKLLWKLEWDKNIPMLFMKEPIDRNRLILALDLKSSEDSFLVLFDKNGAKNEFFGKFEMP